MRRLIMLCASLLLAATQVAAEDPPPRPQTPRTDVGEGTWTYGPFGYDGAGNITAIGSHYFIYDVNGRLKKASVDRPSPAGHPTPTLTQIHEFTYDEYGNMTSGPNATTSLATNPATNHLTALGAVYDAAGNLTQWTPANTTINYGYTYDPLGAMTEVRVNGALKQLHVYTADDERLWTYDMPSNTSHWKIRDLGAKVLRDYFDNGTTWSVARDYIYRDGQLLAAITPTATLHYSLDHLGTPRVVTDASAMRVGFHHYFPFGKEWFLSGDEDEGDVMKFTGHERDRDPAGSTYDVDYMHARYYSATLARFLSPDPARDWSPGRPQAWNLFTYVRQDPVNTIDPDGRIARSLEGNAYVRAIPTVDYDVSSGPGIFGHDKMAEIEAMAAAGDPLAKTIATDTRVGVEPLGLGPFDVFVFGIANMFRRAAGRIGVETVFAMPGVLLNKTPTQVPSLIMSARKAGWRLEKLGRGAHKGQGLVLREVGKDGKLTNRLIRFHPGGGHHGPRPYWTVSSAQGGKVRVFFDDVAAVN